MTTAISERELNLRVKASLPRGAQFGRENFAGDPIVKQFWEWARNELKIDVEMFVSWSCPPEVSILSFDESKILIRSERFDTLLAEYVRLKQAATSQPAISESINTSTILRWMSEFFLGLRLPHAALYSTIQSIEHKIFGSVAIPFRDQSLASIDQVQRAALQCFCLAHELGHLISVERREVSLEITIDCSRIIDYVVRDLDEAAVQAEAYAPMIQLARDRIDASLLLSEIDADLIALEYTAAFIANTFNLDPEDSIRVTLIAYEGQSFVSALRHSCFVLKNRIGTKQDQKQIPVEDWIGSTQVSIRARCMLRRAGFLLSRWSAFDQEQTAKTINRFVPVIDSMFLDSVQFRTDLANITAQQSENIRTHFVDMTADQEKTSFYELLAVAKDNGDVRLELFYTLIMMGFPGGTNPIAWLKFLYDGDYAL